MTSTLYLTQINTSSLHSVLFEVKLISLQVVPTLQTKLQRSIIKPAPVRATSLYAKTTLKTCNQTRCMSADHKHQQTAI